MGQQGSGTNTAIMVGLPILAGVAAGVVTMNPVVGMGVASGTAAAVGAYAQVEATNAQQKQLNIKAKQDQQQVDTQLRTSTLQAAERSAQIRKNLLATLGEQDAVLASRGIALGGGGTAADLRAATEKSSEDDFRINRLNWGAEAATAAYGSRQIKLGQSWNSEQAGFANTAAVINGAAGVAQAGYMGYEGYQSGKAYTGPGGGTYGAGKPRRLTKSSTGMSYGGV